MIDLEKIKPGDMIWYVRWDISRSGKRRNLLPRPVKYEFREYNIHWGRAKIGNPGESRYRTVGLRDLWHTEEEAWEEFNKDIYGTIDKLTSEYENAIKYLKSKIHINGTNT